MPSYGFLWNPFNFRFQGYHLYDLANNSAGKLAFCRLVKATCSMHGLSGKESQGQEWDSKTLRTGSPSLLFPLSLPSRLAGLEPSREGGLPLHRPRLSVWGLSQPQGNHMAPILESGHCGSNGPDARIGPIQTTFPSLACCHSYNNSVR